MIAVLYGIDLEIRHFVRIVIMITVLIKRITTMITVLTKTQKMAFCEDCVITVSFRMQSWSQSPYITILKIYDIFVNTANMVVVLIKKTVIMIAFL